MLTLRKPLKILEIGLRGSSIHDKGRSMLFTVVVSNLAALETLEIRADDTQITCDKTSEKNIPLFSRLLLNLKKPQTTEKAINALEKPVLTMVNLQSLSLVLKSMMKA